MTDCQSGSGHVSPEAAAGGPITLMEAGHIIEIDVPNRRVSLYVPDSELDSRRAAWKRPARKINYGSVARYATQVISADSGAVLVQPVL